MRRFRYFIEHISREEVEHGKFPEVFFHSKKYEGIWIDKDTLVGYIVVDDVQHKKVMEHPTITVLSHLHSPKTVHSSLEEQNMSYKASILKKDSNVHGIHVEEHHTTVDLVEMILRTGNNHLAPNM